MLDWWDYSWLMTWPSMRKMWHCHRVSRWAVSRYIVMWAAAFLHYLPSLRYTQIIVSVPSETSYIIRPRWREVTASFSPQHYYPLILCDRTSSWQAAARMTPWIPAPPLRITIGTAKVWSTKYVRHELLAKDKECFWQVGDMDVYRTGSGNKCIIWCYDIYGFTVTLSWWRDDTWHVPWQGGRTRQLCDTLGDAGYLVLLPDFFRGEWRVSGDI